MSLADVHLIRDAAAIKRFHTKRTIRAQTNGEHSFGVATLIVHVYPECRQEVLTAALFHDLPELDTGDVPGPVKRRHPALAQLLSDIEQASPLCLTMLRLEPHEKLLLKWADRMEQLLWSLEEYKMGNRNMLPTIKVMMGLIQVSPCPNFIAVHALNREVREHLMTLGIAPAVGAELENTP